MQGNHSQPAGPVAERVLATELSSFDQRGCQAPESQKRRYPGLPALGPHFLEGCGFHLHPVRVVQVVQKLPPDRGEGTVSGRQSLLPPFVLSVLSRGFGVVEKHRQIDVCRSDVEDIARRLTHYR